MANFSFRETRKQFWKQENTKLIYDFIYVFVGYVVKRGKKRKRGKKKT